ncbi:type II toxin-antitoxin system VapC family toxin [Halorutilales archaeon Cl-col2-1]
MITFVDTSALISLLREDHEFNQMASDLLGDAYSKGSLIINGIVYSELGADPYFDNEDDLNAFLDDTRLKIRRPDEESMFLAGERFRSYLENRSDKLQCPTCGRKVECVCPDCKENITLRQHLPSDFLIGAHAETDADQLITFDKGFFETYFDIRTLGIKN